MALTDLVYRLEQEAQSQVEAIEREAEREAVALEAATEQAIASASASRLERERAERRAASQREATLARMRAHARELEARHALLARIFDRARAHVPEIATAAQYRDALPSHLAEALSFLDGLQPRVRCQSAFAPSLDSAIARCHGAELVIDESVGPGVMAIAADGSVVVDNTLASRLARAAPRLAIELLKQVDNGRG